jgi:hypothetical protein
MKYCHSFQHANKPRRRDSGFYSLHCSHVGLFQILPLRSFARAEILSLGCLFKWQAASPSGLGLAITHSEKL